MTPQEKLSYIYYLLFEFATQKVLQCAVNQNGTPVLNDLINTLEMAVEEASPDNFTEVGLNLQSGPLEAAVFHFQFVINADFFIVNFNTVVVDRLGYNADELHLMRFVDFLTANSQQQWHQLTSMFVTAPPSFSVVELVFVSKDLKLLPLLCSVSSLRFGSFIFVTSISCLRADVTSLKLSNKNTAEERETGFSRVLHAYILDHLDVPLPPLKHFALQYGASTTSLYNAYHGLYGCTPYQSYQEARLNKSYALIQHTSIQLKEIGFLCGFENYLNFYKAFKKRFGFAPGQLERGF